MQRTSFDFDVITGPVSPRLAPIAKPEPDSGKPNTGNPHTGQPHTGQPHIGKNETRQHKAAEK